jgi:hypothetical protein
MPPSSRPSRNGLVSTRPQHSRVALYANSLSREHPELTQQGACFRLARAGTAGIRARDIWGPDGAYTPLFLFQPYLLQHLSRNIDVRVTECL